MAYGKENMGSTAAIFLALVACRFVSCFCDMGSIAARGYRITIQTSATGSIGMIRGSNEIVRTIITMASELRISAALRDVCCSAPKHIALGVRIHVHSPFSGVRNDS